MPDTRKYKVGLVQMSMGPDPEANFEAAQRHIREAAGRGANIVCLPELFRAQYFCQREDVAFLTLRSRFPVRRPRGWANWRVRCASPSWRRFLSGAPPAFTTTRP